MKEANIAFGRTNRGTHIGCFFHLKQAWFNYLFEMCHLCMEEIKKALESGMLDLLCILPHNEGVKYGIPFLRSIFEKDCSAKELERWNKFWNYFARQWIPILDRWNIVNKENDCSHFDVVNCTNNGLERYKHHFTDSSGRNLCYWNLFK